MRCVVCTLFEHHYHLGVAVLVNSLIRWGFKGPIYAGFRGSLPPWAESQGQRKSNGHIELQVSPDVRIIFVPLETSAHLTNYKPDFMLQVEQWAAEGSDALIYCDPDVVLDIEWGYIEDWLTCGVAVCEDINSPLPANHPTRIGWRRFFKGHGHDLGYRTESYANGGFVGLTWSYRKFLLVWQEFMLHIGNLLGGSNVVGIDGGELLKSRYGFADCFSKTDQDALNAVMEALPEIPVSFLAREAMGFQHGRTLLPHALGSSKPWNRRYLKMAFSGMAPRTVDKIYWANAEGPIQPFSSAHISSIRTQLAICSGVGRFIRRTN